MWYHTARSCILSALLVGLVLATAAAAQPVIYVDADADGAETGTSWADAYEELDEALEAAPSGSQIWVAEGVYYPTDDPDRTESFFLRSGVEVLGGFTGTETSADQRIVDPDENGTVLSCDIGTIGDPSDNCYHVVTAIDVDNTAVLDGFLVTGGNADGSAPNERGGGLTNYDGGSSSPDTEGYPTLRNVAFEGNSASGFGGGMYLNVAVGTTVLEDVEFKENEARRGGGLYTNASIDGEGVEFEENEAMQRGGGAFILGLIGDEAIVTLRDVEFDSNVAGDDDTPGEPGRGAGFYTDGNPTVVIIDAEFELNRSIGTFGDGAGFLMQGGTVSVVNAVFYGNTGRAGSAFMTRNVSSSVSLTVTNAVIAGNQGAETDWGVIDLNQETDATLSHITVSGNDGFAAMRFAGDSNVELHNAIVWDNDFEDAPIVVQQTGGTIDVDHAIIEGGFTDGEAVLAADPLFLRTPDDGPDDEWGTDDDDYGDLRLGDGSPALGFGDLDLVPQDDFDLDDDGVTGELIPFDLDGEARVQDGNVELGAYEGIGSLVSSESGASVVGSLALSAPYPNPARGRAALALTLGSADQVEVAVFDILGRRVVLLHEGPLAAGRHPVALDGAALPAGLYIVRAVSASGTATRRVTVLR
jgi:hypothetical protein